MNKKLLIGLLIVIVLVVAYWLISPSWRRVVMNEDLPVGSGTSSENVEDGSGVIARGTMMPQAHEVEGTALFVKSGDDTFLRFENLKTINGPDLRIYLSSDLDIEDAIDLGPIRATEGNVNYLIPPGTDLSRYKNVLIWCRTFAVLFSYAELR